MGELELDKWIIAFNSAPIAAICGVCLFAIKKYVPDIKEYFRKNLEKEYEQIASNNRLADALNEQIASNNRVAEALENNTRAFNDMKKSNGLITDKIDEIKKLIIETRDSVNGVQTEVAFLSRDFDTHIKQKG